MEDVCLSARGLWSVWSLAGAQCGGIWTLSSLSRMAVAAQLSPSFPHHPRPAAVPCAGPHLSARS